MPKQLYKIVQFHGGLNSNSDARDIADSELSEATDVMVDELGKIRLMGGTTAHVSGSPEDDQATGWAGTLIPGYGLFQFSHDRLGAEDRGAGDAITGDDYLAIYDGNDGQVWIYSRVRDVWDDIDGTANTGVIDIGSNNTSTAQVSYYSADGTLRVCDGLHTNSNIPQWYGYIQRSHFVEAWEGFTAPVQVDYSKWVASDQQMSAPTRGLIGNGNVTGYQLDGENAGTSGTALTDADAFTGYTDADFTDNDYIAVNSDELKYATVSAWVSVNELTTTTIPDNWNNTDQWVLFPAAGTGFNINMTFVSSGSWPDAITYEFAASFVYDGNQETGLYYYNDTVASTENYGLELVFHCIGNFDPRYTDFRLYYRESTAADPAWFFLAEVSLAKGGRVMGALELGAYTGWRNSPAGGVASNGTTLYGHQTEVNVLAPSTALTYSLKSGVPEDQRITSPKYKTAVVANRKAYIGNVQYTDSESLVQTKGDAVMKSIVNQFDTFGLNGLIEASVNDGDSIVKLEAYADRLLIFKKNKMELLNVSQEVEFLEDTFLHKGVSNPAATCKTDFGIAWANEQGCYLYDGQKVNNLLEKQGRQIIKESEWSDFVDEPMIGYLPKKRQIIVADDITTTGDGAAYLYDIVTQSWVKGADATITDQAKTNFITDWNGDLVYAHTAGTLVKWDDAADTSAAVDIKTKDVDFGHPGQVKRIYKFYITYKSSGAGNLVFVFFKDGRTNATTSVGSPFVDTSGQWSTISPSVTTFSCYSLLLRFYSSGTTPADFEINDITIVYRLKGQR